MRTTKNTLSFFISLLLIFIFTYGNVTSQIVKKKTKYKPAILTIEFLGTFSVPLPHLYGDISDFFKFESYGVKYGFGSQLNFKLATDKKGTIRPYATLGYSLFLGKDNSTAFIGGNTISNGYPLPDGEQFTPTSGKSKIFIHDFYTGLGFEYAFMNRTRWTPYLGTDVDLNVLFGTYKQTPAGQSEVSFTIKEAVRFGFSVGGGVQARFGRAAGIVISTRYRFANLLGKSSKRETEVNKMQLLDKSATELNTSLSKSRNIDYIEFGAGVVFFIGRK